VGYTLFGVTLVALLLYVSFTLSPPSAKPSRLSRYLAPLHESLRPTRLARTYAPLQIVRKLAFVWLTQVPPDYAYLQIQAFLLMSTLTLSYILLVRPYEVREKNWLEAFNEGAIMCASIHLVMFTEYAPNAELHYAAGCSLIGILLFNLLVNILVISHSLLGDIKKFWLKLKKGCGRLRVFSTHIKKYAVSRTSMRRRNLYSSAIKTTLANDLSTVSQSRL